MEGGGGRAHVMYCDGSCKGRSSPPGLAGDAQIHDAVNISCGYMLFVLNDTSSLKFQQSSRFGALVNRRCLSGHSIVILAYFLSLFGRGHRVTTFCFNFKIIAIFLDVIKINKNKDDIYRRIPAKYIQYTCRQDSWANS